MSNYVTGEAVSVTALGAWYGSVGHVKHEKDGLVFVELPSRRGTVTLGFYPRELKQHLALT